MVLALAFTMVVEKQIFAKELDVISRNAAPDKIFKADIIILLFNAKRFYYSSGPFWS